jgi:D-alanine-D-alanine ligase
MTSRLKVGLIFGGRSVEHEVSVVSARAVAGALAAAKMTCVPIGVTKTGDWLTPEHSARILDGNATCVERPPAGGEGVVIDPGGRTLRQRGDGPSGTPLKIDVIFPLIHGWGGEDGRLQGALELAAIPYVGAGVLGSACGMDKATSRLLFAASGLQLCPWLTVSAHDYRKDATGWQHRIVDTLGLPVFVKPSSGGSSLGITKVGLAAELAAAMDLALQHDSQVVIEHALDAREIECAVLGNAEPNASGLGEIEPAREFYDYQAKYEDDRSVLRIPAPLPAELAATIREQALTAYRALRLTGFARVDFLLERGSNTVYINEVNTLPGFTPISMFPKLWEAEGLAYPELVEQLVTLALE